MSELRITPKLVLTGCAMNLLAWLCLYMPWRFGWTPRLWAAESVIRTAFAGGAFLIAFFLCREIADEYRRSRWMRIAWLALAANALISVVRIIIECSLFNLVWAKYKSGPIFGLAQHLAIVPANACLLIGFLAIGWTYYNLGLGFRIEKRDYAACIGVLLLMVGLLYFRAGLSEARSPYPAGRWLQLIGLVLLSLSAAASFLLHRLAVQMEGGKLALALRCLTFYTLLRGVLVLAQARYRIALLDGYAPSDILPLFFEPAWQSVSWIALLAAAYRSELTTHAVRELAQHRAAKAALASV